MRRSDVVFFLSGAAALAYEATWARLLARLVGGDARGLALVLAVFMGGLGLGARLLARPAAASRAPERLFALVTAGVGVWAALSPWLLAGLEPARGLAGRVGLAVLVLLVPTVGMGATFPLMGRLTIRSAAESGRATSAFYGANTLGGAAGALVGPLVLVPLLGLARSMAAAAVLDLAAAALALLWLRAASPPQVATTPEVPGVPSRPAPRARPAPERERGSRGSELGRPRGGVSDLLVATALAGASALALEVSLQRVLVTVTGASVYALAIVLAVFLGGLGLGSRMTAREPRPGARGLAPGTDTLCAALALAPALACAGLFLLRLQLGERDLFGGLQNRMPAGASVAALWASHALFAALALLPPTLAFGAALPSAVAAALARRPTAPREPLLGAVYAANTLGALVGSLAAGFLLLPRLGPRLAVAAALAPALAGALVVARGATPALVRRTGPAVLAATAVLAWLALRPAPGAADAAVLVRAFGSHAAVTVEEAPAEGGSAPVRSLRVNGKVVATTAPVDLRLQRLLAYLPAALHGAVEDALVVGLGTGMTAGALLDLPTLRELRVVEIEPAVERGARAFGPWNGELLDDSRTTLVIADGHTELLVDERRWDLVTADPIHPWTRGSSDLYALEHFRAMAARLAPGGVASQWLPLYQLSLADVKTVVATWCASFEHVSAWLTAYDLVLVGSREPLPGPGALAELDLAERFGPALAAHAAEAGVHSGCELAALLAADDAALRELAAGVAPMRADRPVLEFRAPLSYLAGYSVEALRWAGRPEVVDALPETCRPRARELRALLERFLAELPSGLSRAAERYGRALLALGPVER